MTPLAWLLIIVGLFWWPATVAALPLVAVLSWRERRARKSCAVGRFLA